MVFSRVLTSDDYELLKTLLKNDEYHSDTSVDFFYEEGTACNVYCDEKGPILFLRGSSVLCNGIGFIQLDIQFIKNEDTKRNMKAMIEGFPELENRAKENGFSGFFFVSTVPRLRRFCIKYLGFSELSENLLGKVLVGKAQEEMV